MIAPRAVRTKGSVAKAKALNRMTLIEWPNIDDCRFKEAHDSMDQASLAYDGRHLKARTDRAVHMICPLPSEGMEFKLACINHGHIKEVLAAWTRRVRLSTGAKDKYWLYMQVSILVCCTAAQYPLYGKQTLEEAAKIAKRKADAKTTPGKGVVSDAKFYNNQQALCGYLGLARTAHLRVLMYESAKVSSILNAWHDLRLRDWESEVPGSIRSMSITEL